MTRTQENTLTMWTTTNSVLNKNTGIWTGIKAFAYAVNLFRQIRLELDPEADVQRTYISGITEEKSKERVRLNTLAGQMAKNIEAYAINAKDIILERQYAFTPSYFNKLRDNAVTGLAKAIFEQALKLQEELEDYGVGKKQIAALNVAIEEYKAINSAPKEAKDDVKIATVNIVQKFKDGKQQLELMDKMIGNFSEAHPNFVAAFNNARVVINLGYRPKTHDTPTNNPEKPE